MNNTEFKNMSVVTTYENYLELGFQSVDLRALDGEYEGKGIYTDEMLTIRDGNAEIEVPEDDTEKGKITIADGCKIEMKQDQVGLYGLYLSLFYDGYIIVPVNAWKREGEKITIRMLEISKNKQKEYVFDQGIVTEKNTTKRLFRASVIDTKSYAYTEYTGHYMFYKEDLNMEFMEIEGRYYHVNYARYRQ